VKVDENNVVMIGGAVNDVSNFTDTVQKLSVTGKCSCGNEYRTLAPLPEPMSNMECSLMPGGQNILVTGGMNLTAELGAATYIYNLESDEWTVSNPTRHQRYGHEMVTVGKNVYVFGGGWHGPEDTDTCERENDFTSIEMLDYTKDYTSNPQAWNWDFIDKKLEEERFQAASVLVPRSLFPECI